MDKKELWCEIMHHAEIMNDQDLDFDIDMTYNDHCKAFDHYYTRFIKLYGIDPLDLYYGEN